MLKRLFVTIGLIALTITGDAHATELTWDIDGVDADQLSNIEAFLGKQWGVRNSLASRFRRDRFVQDTEDFVREALRPFGYYSPQLSSRLEALDDDQWLYQLTIDPGPAVIVRSQDIQVTGPGAELAIFQDWLSDWPISTGAVLRQPAWDEHKLALSDAAAENGFFSATFVQQTISIDVADARADLAMIFDTGERARMGTIRYEQDFLDDDVLNAIARFKPGDPFQGWLLDELRVDLWKTGQFDDIEITEFREDIGDHVVVNLLVKLDENNTATHQGTIGYGTDTEFRTQYRWQLHRLSNRGDTLSAGFAWQSRNQELLLFGEYRLPRQTGKAQYWLLSPQYRKINQDFALDIEGEAESLRIGSGEVETTLVRMGHVNLRNSSTNRQRIIETLYVDYLFERTMFEQFVDGFSLAEDATTSSLDRNRDAISLGADWDWPVVTGQGFNSQGHRERAWLFTSNEAWGSDLDFTQAYLSSRVNLRFADRWRLLLRGEVGYTDVEVVDREFSIDGVDYQVSLTDLPERYRFKAGGSYSVRGYDFESLSNNGIGSNHIFTASAEVEYLFRDSWSVAAFVDTGNAFNDWGAANLRTGYGLGVRWYTVGFPLRLDIAQAASLDGEPWQIHFTLGSSLF